LGLKWGGGGEREKEATTLHSAKSPPVPEGRLPALAAALTKPLNPEFGSVEGSGCRGVSTGEEGEHRGGGCSSAPENP